MYFTCNSFFGHDFWSGELERPVTLSVNSKVPDTVEYDTRYLNYVIITCVQKPTLRVIISTDQGNNYNDKRNN